MMPAALVTAMVMPLDPAGVPDVAGWRALLQKQRDAGVDGVLLDQECLDRMTAERSDLLGRTVAWAGTGMAVMVAPAGWPDPLQVEAWWKAGVRHLVLELSDSAQPAVALDRMTAGKAWDVFLRAAPTGNALEALMAVSGHERVKGLIEDSGEPVRLRALQALAGRPDLVLLSGHEGTACLSLLAGFDGMVSRTAALLPRTHRHLVAQAIAGHGAAAHAWDARLAPYRAFLAGSDAPDRVRTLWQLSGMDAGVIRPDLVPSPTYAGQACRLAAGIADLEDFSGRT